MLFNINQEMALFLELPSDLIEIDISLSRIVANAFR
jgi:hypothetical protein